MIGQSDVKRPYIELPFVDTKDAAKDRTRMNANPHIQINLYAETIPVRLRRIVQY